MSLAKFLDCPTQLILALKRRAADHAFEKDITKSAFVAGQAVLFENWFGAIQAGVRSRVRSVIETMLEEELDEALSRQRYGRTSAQPRAPMR